MFTYTAADRVIDIEFVGSNAFVLPYSIGGQGTISQLEILNVSDPNSITQVQTVPVSGLGIDVQYDASNERIAAAYRGPGNVYGVDVFDVNTPTAPQNLGTVETVNYKPVRCFLDNDLLVVAGTSKTNNSSHFLVYGISDIDNPNMLLDEQISTSGLWDTILLDNVFIVSIPGASSVNTYVYYNDENELLIGPAEQFDEPVWGLNGFFETEIEGPQSPTVREGVQVNLLRFIIYVSQELGGFDALIMKKNKPVSQQVTLRVIIDPSEAAENGCNTVPAPGDHEYDINTELNVHAIPNPTDGWFFIKWYGDVSGTELSAHLIMDRDKLAVAQFGELKLTVSGNEQKRIFCASEINEENRQVMLPVTLCASEVDGWNVTQIKFKTNGTGDESDEVVQAKVFQAGSELYSGFIVQDNGLIEATFDPPISIGAGECTTVYLDYDFKFLDPNTYASDEPKSFLVETETVVAKPWNYEEGLITGIAEADTFYIGRVYNTNDYVFSTIDGAVKSSKTVDGDTCIVCPGNYTEAVEIYDSTKSLTVIGKEGKEYTTVRPPNNSDSPISIGARVKDITVSGFTLEALSLQNSRQSKASSLSSLTIAQEGLGIGGSAKNTRVNNMAISGFGLGMLIAGHSSGAIVENIHFNNCTQGIGFGYTESNIVRNNTFSGLGGDEPSIIIEYESHNNSIINNTSDGIFSIMLKETNGNTVSLNKATTESSNSYIQLEEICNNNTIELNEKMEIRLLADGDRNKIQNNTTRRIRVRSDFRGITNPLITGNTVRNFDFTGIDVEGTFGKIQNLVLTNNKVYSMKYNGIKLSGVKHFDMGYNKVYNNGYSGDVTAYSGISIVGCEHGNIYDNKIYRNARHGLDIENSKDIDITDNRITLHDKTKFSLFEGIGINLKNVNTAYIASNQLLSNCDAINVEGGSNIRIAINVINESFCIYSGIHVSGSNPVIEGNNILNNNGSGIVLENGALPVIMNNNIYGNSEYGINNLDPNVNVSADNNYWGKNSEPGGDDLSGSVAVNTWLPSEVSVVYSIDSDTVKVYPGVSDSLVVNIRNLIDNDYEVDVVLEDTEGWLIPPLQQPLISTDSTGAAAKVYYEVPADEGGDAVNQITISTYAVSNDSLLFSEKIYLSTYSRIPTRLIVAPDSVSVQAGDTLLFATSCYDQNEIEMPATVTWNATSGTINNEGLFIAGNTPGLATISAEMTSGSITGEAQIFVSTEQPMLNSIMVEPDTVTLKPAESIRFTSSGFDQNGMRYSVDPVWSADGGSIDIDGLFIADSIAGVYYVTALDTVTGVFGEAVVTISPVVSIKDKEEIPTNYVLHQNYPNPFNPETKISFGLPYAGRVSIEVYNILGQRVDILADEFMLPGYKEITWKPNHISSGVYILVMKTKPDDESTDRFNGIRKMIYLK